MRNEVLEGKDNARRMNVWREWKGGMTVRVLQKRKGKERKGRGGNIQPQEVDNYRGGLVSRLPSTPSPTCTFHPPHIHTRTQTRLAPYPPTTVFGRPHPAGHSGG